MAEVAPRTSPTPLAPGTLFAEHFRIGEALGVGATGVVYAALDLRSDQPVALKLLHEHLRADPRLDRRFRREFRSGSSLNHPNVVRVFAREEGPAGALYLVMELLRGRNLAQVLREAGRLPIARIARILDQILDAVGCAHDQGIVHRDLKPGNVMVLDGGDDVVKVCDFGIAKLLRHEGPVSEDTDLTSLSLLGDVLGTPAYMSPEQARGETLDGRSDLYAVAVMLYQMVAGELPFRAPTPLGMVSRHLSERPVPPSRRRTDLIIDPRLDELILRGLAKDQEERPATAAQFRQALEQIAAARPEAIRVRTGGEIAVDPHPSEPPPTILLGGVSPHAPAPRPPAPRRIPVAMAVAAMVVLAPAIWWVARGRPPAPPPGRSVAAGPVAAVPVASAPDPVASAPVAPPPATAPATAEPPVAAPKATASPEPAARNRRRQRAAPPAPSVGAQLADAETRLRAGDPEGACAIAARLRAQPGPAAAVYRLSGKCLMRLGRAEEAKRDYRRYLELAPDAEDAPFVRGILER